MCCDTCAFYYECDNTTRAGDGCFPRCLEHTYCKGTETEDGADDGDDREIA